MWRRFGWWVIFGIVLYVAIGGIVLFNAPKLLLLNWFPDLTDNERAAFLGPAANVVLLALGGTIALVGVGLSLSRHRQELEAAERDRQRLSEDQRRELARVREVDAQRRIDAERALRERFVTTVGLLSDASPVNRQAAMFSLGALADDWAALEQDEEVQVCVEVITGYLRAPRSSDMLMPLLPEDRNDREPDEERRAQRTRPQEVSVKQAGYDVIRNHLRRDATHTWGRFQFDLTGAHIDFRVDLTDIHLPHSRGGLIFDEAVVAPGARVRFSGNGLRGFVRFDKASLAGGLIEASALTSSGSGEISFTNAILSGLALIDLDHRVPGNELRVNLFDATVRDRARIKLRGATILNGGEVDLHGATWSVNLPGQITTPSGRRLKTPGHLT